MQNNEYLIWSVDTTLTDPNVSCRISSSKLTDLRPFSKVSSAKFKSDSVRIVDITVSQLLNVVVLTENNGSNAHESDLIELGTMQFEQRLHAFPSPSECIPVDQGKSPKTCPEVRAASFTKSGRQFIRLSGDVHSRICTADS